MQPGAQTSRTTTRAEGWRLPVPAAGAHPPSPPALAAWPALTQLFQSPSVVVPDRPEGAEGERHRSLMQEPLAGRGLPPNRLCSFPAVTQPLPLQVGGAPGALATRLLPSSGMDLKGPERN